MNFRAKPGIFLEKNFSNSKLEEFLLERERLFPENKESFREKISSSDNSSPSFHEMEESFHQFFRLFHDVVPGWQGNGPRCNCVVT